MEEIKFGTFTDPRDGHQYRTVKIGKQEWFAENLCYKTVGGNADDGKGSYVYENKPENEAKFGRLYTWTAAMDLPYAFVNKIAFETRQEKEAVHRGIAPEGWHIPSDEEWKEMIKFVHQHSDMDSGTALKSKEGWKEDPEGCPAGTDEFGFCILPAGRRQGDQFLYLNKGGHFWTSTEKDSVYADRWGITYTGMRIEVFENFKGNALPIRCVKDR